jgi:hypothetical protein
VVNSASRPLLALDAFTRDSSKHLNSDSNLTLMIASGRTTGQGKRDAPQGRARAGQGSSVMARFELPEFSLSGMGEAPATADTMFELGMMYASGRDVPVDLVSAHKWFNIAATKGHVEAARLRREIAAEMSDAEIGQAQRTARDWLKANPEPVAPPAMAPAMMLRAAA